MKRAIFTIATLAAGAGALLAAAPVAAQVFAATRPVAGSLPTFGTVARADSARRLENDFYTFYKVPPGILDAEALRLWRVQPGEHRSSEEIGVDYAWRNLRVEGAVEDYRPSRDVRNELEPSRRLFAGGGRLSFRPSPHFAVQITRRKVNLHHLPDPGDNVRRTSIAVSIDKPLQKGGLQTIVALGRSGTKANGQATNAYLFESAWRFNHHHIVFARVERTTADELFTDRDALHGQNFNARRSSLGYVHALPMVARSQMSVGGLLARRDVPAGVGPRFHDARPEFKVFMRLSLHLP